MNTEDRWNQQDAWDHVVDGPLTPQELAELVSACDRRPELWRQCALALLEEQTLRHELSAMAREQMSANSRQAVDKSSIAPLPCPASSQNHPSDVAAARPDAKSSSVWSTIALAASMMICLAIGWQAAQRFASNRMSHALGNNEPDARRADLVANPSSGRPEVATVPQLDDTGGNMFANQSRVIDPATIDRVNEETLKKTLQVNLSDQLEPEYQQLKRRGYEVESQEGFVPIWLYDGSTAVVPYRQIKVRPKSVWQSY